MPRWPCPLATAVSPPLAWAIRLPTFLFAVEQAAVIPFTPLVATFVAVAVLTGFGNGRGARMS
jgi:hypothetical protein